MKCNPSSHSLPWILTWTLATYALGPGCTSPNPDVCPVRDANSCPSVCPDLPPPSPLPDLTVLRTELDFKSTVSVSTDCSSYWKQQGGAYKFDGTAFLTACGNGYFAECNTYLKTPLDLQGLQAKPLRIEVQQQYQLESGVIAPTFMEPYAVRILSAEIRVYDGDSEPPTGSRLLARFPLSGQQPLPQKHGYYLPPTGKDKVYVALRTRLDCSKYPPPQSQKWTWDISRIRVFEDIDP